MSELFSTRLLKKCLWSILFGMASLGLLWGLAHADPIDVYKDSAHDSDGNVIPYLWTPVRGGGVPRYIWIVMPGGSGKMNIHQEDGHIEYDFKRNFLIRARHLIADEKHAVVALDSDDDPVRMRLVIADIRRHYPAVKIYIVGTSRSTLDTIHLSDPLDGEVAGFIHTSSMDEIRFLNTRNRKSRHLIVAHREDTCRQTSPQSAIENHDKFGTPLIIMEGGITEGNACEARAHHGYNGIEAETIRRIKAWIARS